MAYSNKIAKMIKMIFLVQFDRIEMCHSNLRYIVTVSLLKESIVLSHLK